MIDNKALSDKEKWWSALADFHSIPEYATEAEIIRNARRYLALRENEIAILTAAINGFDADTYRAEYDAVADRLLENKS